MRLIQLTTATMPINLTLAADDLLLLRQDACYLLRAATFCQQYSGQVRALAHDVAQRQIVPKEVPLLSDEQWVELCAEAQVVMLWR
jgi:sulfur transfer complex TusBCD TusB component (DsrH family)